MVVEPAPLPPASSSPPALWAPPQQPLWCVRLRSRGGSGSTRGLASCLARSRAPVWAVAAMLRARGVCASACALLLGGVAGGCAFAACLATAAALGRGECSGLGLKSIL